MERLTTECGKLEQDLDNSEWQRKKQVEILEEEIK